MRNDEKESSESETSAVFRSDRSVSTLLLLLLQLLLILFVYEGIVGVASHFHGRVVTSTTTGRFSFRILDVRSDMAIGPGPTGSLGMNNRITLFGWVDDSA